MENADVAFSQINDEPLFATGGCLLGIWEGEWTVPTRSKAVKRQGFKMLSRSRFMPHASRRVAETALDKRRYPALRSGLGKTHGVARFLQSAGA